MSSYLSLPTRYVRPVGEKIRPEHEPAPCIVPHVFVPHQGKRRGDVEMDGRVSGNVFHDGSHRKPVRGIPKTDLHHPTDGILVAEERAGRRSGNDHPVGSIQCGDRVARNRGKREHLEENWFGQ